MTMMMKVMVMMMGRIPDIIICCGMAFGVVLWQTGYRR